MNGVEQRERRTAVSELEGRMTVAIATAVSEEAQRTNSLLSGLQVRVAQAAEDWRAAETAFMRSRRFDMDAARKIETDAVDRTEVLRRGFRGRMRWLFLGK